MIGKSKLNNQELVSNIYQSTLVIIIIKALTHLLISYWVVIFGPAENNADAAMFRNVLNVSNFANSVLAPIALIYLIRCVCELIYRFTSLIRDEN